MQTMVEVCVQTSETAVIIILFIDLQVQRVKGLTHRTHAFTFRSGFL